MSDAFEFEASKPIVHFAEFSGHPFPIAIWTPRYIAFKSAFDFVAAIIALPICLGVCVVLLVLNPFFNPGSLFYSQERMGLGGKRFRMWKFRSMQPAGFHVRAHDAELEEDRITRLGKFIRRTRIDEMPNFYNVLRREMSVIGPRPDVWDHSVVFAETIPYYLTRFRVRPGITGLAQVMGGYADNVRAVERKARFDQFYVRKSRARLDLMIMRRTIWVIFTGFGAR